MQLELHHQRSRKEILREHIRDRQTETFRNRQPRPLVPPTGEEGSSDQSVLTGKVYIDREKKEKIGSIILNEFARGREREDG